MKVLVVDDHPIIRKNISSILSLDHNIDRIFYASNVHDAVQMVKIHNPEMVFIDLRLGKESGLDIISKTRKYDIKSSFVILSNSTKIEDFNKAKKFDIDGYIYKKSSPKNLLNAIKIIKNNKKYYDPKVYKNL
ncbi:response regulator transcription factor [Clostridiaceae bacterium M8S5]|nr:response regulator transcription factor [Clostridiaceae bacterium M8S5]